MLYPQNFEHKIGFDSVREAIVQKTLSTQGAEIIALLSFSSDIDVINLSLERIADMMKLFAENRPLPRPEVIDLREAFARTSAQGTFLETCEIADIRTNLTTLTDLHTFIINLDDERFTHLKSLALGVNLFPDILLNINKIIDKFGEVRDSASPALASIRREIAQAQSSRHRELNRILTQARAEGIVEKDVAPTLREGRLVIPVASMNKRAIKGIVHDESATGKTSFIEPAAVVEINNRIRELSNAERREIIRILIEFTDTIRPFYQDINESLTFVAQIDALRAKALYSYEIKAIAPHLSDACPFDWRFARHPLLEENLRKQGKHIEPLNIALNPKQRILIISGPNAGGKSVCLKTVGLLQYMLQCGLPIPLDERSSAGIFKSIFIDIGDEQSIENDLSTYSSHLLNMKHCAKYANGRTLLLIDEFGTGTEPQLGGAIAEALLNRFNNQHAYGIITTHYTNIKHYAARTQGVVNAAMLYDRKGMRPMFMLSIGTAGSSFAIEIARKIGLPDDVIKAAEEMIGSEQVDFDKHLQDVARDKRYWENKRNKIHEQEKQLNALIDEYNQKLASVKQIERDTLAEARNEAADIIKKANAQIENTIRIIKENAAEKEITRASREQLKKQRDDLLNSNTTQPAPKTTTETVKTGDNVIIAGQNVPGKVIDVQGKSAVVLFGNIKSTVAIEKLQKVSGNEARRIVRVGARTNEVAHEHKINFSQQLDIRGMRVEEAIPALIYYLDDAQMSGVSYVRILHGTGTGALRQAVREHLRNERAIHSFHDEDVRLGGAGITVVEFK